MSKLPEPVSQRLRIGDSPDWAFCASESDADFYGKQSGRTYVKEHLYSESQVKELLAERDAVLKMALDALEVSWKTDEGEAAIQVIRKLLNEPQSTHTAR